MYITTVNKNIKGHRLEGLFHKRVIANARAPVDNVS
jgi:hypothetical protein